MADPGVRKLLADPTFQKRLAYFAVDEAHLVSAWGLRKDGKKQKGTAASATAFRKEFAELGNLRTLLGSTVPFLVLSGTLPPDVLADVKERLFLVDPVFVDAGIDRPNLPMHRLRAEHAIGSFFDLLCFIPLAATTPADLPTTIFYVSSRREANLLTSFVREHLPFRDALDAPCVKSYHAGFSTAYKRRTMRRFKEGGIRFLVATIAAGMGMNVPNVRRVVNYGKPTSLVDLVQRWGRAGRDGKAAEVVVILPATVFEAPKPVDADAVPGKGGKVADPLQGTDPKLADFARLGFCYRLFLIWYSATGEQSARDEVRRKANNPRKVTSPRARTSRTRPRLSLLPLPTLQCSCRLHPSAQHNRTLRAVHVPGPALGGRARCARTSRSHGVPLGDRGPARVGMLVRPVRPRERVILARRPRRVGGARRRGGRGARVGPAGLESLESHGRRRARGATVGARAVAHDALAGGRTGLGRHPDHVSLRHAAHPPRLRGAPLLVPRPLQHQVPLDLHPL